MAFNKSKALESALKYLNQGKVNQAIAEYQQVLRSDPKDQATLMTVGDLFARQGDMGHALEYFERLAQVYLADGFNSKAIAIYKKIGKLAPTEIGPLEKLADLYVQQGVLSEARPLFLQIAEAHLKANRAPKAVEVLHRLLEVEPENPRVQMRLAELYNVMGQKGDAAKTYFAYGQRLFDRGEVGEAEKLIERALEVAPGDAPALLLKARILVAADKEAAAIKVLEKHPEADAGTDVTNLLVDLELKNGQVELAADRARNQLVRGNSHFGLLFHVTASLIEKGQVEEALPLFRELRDPMIEVNEHDKFVKLLTAATERLPESTEALELLADFCRHTSDPFPLNVALTKLVSLYEAAGNNDRTEQLLDELVDRNRDDERLQLRLDELRVRMGKISSSTGQIRAQEESAVVSPFNETSVALPSGPVPEEVLDSITERYVSQALTDVDLFSSYGLTQKAANLLESVLQRAPRHIPTLERLLDLSLGAGNERRTAELAATLEDVYRSRADQANADRFAELRGKYQSTAELTDEQSGVASQPAAPQPMEFHVEVEPASVGAVPVDMSPDTMRALPEAAIPLVAARAANSPDDLENAGIPVGEGRVGGEEVDLSDEWEAMVQEVIEPASATVIEESAPVTAAGIEASEATDFEIIEDPAPAESDSNEGGVFEIEDDTTDLAAEHQPLDLQQELSDEVVPADALVADDVEFELELTPESTEVESKGATSTEQFISELAAEVEGIEILPADEETAAVSENIWSEVPSSAAPIRSPVLEASFAHASDEPTVESLNQLSEVFQEFRSEFGELAEEDEDLETHYNLGIAYREMGLLEEAIGEFQKVAKAVQKGKPFRYTMNCATLLALSFRDKGEPKISALWYRRALEVPGLDQEAIMALRYDLGISLEMAGEADAALDCFRQVYATNIDYRDVADRIATLQHH